jgi:hypothetical protein
MLYDSQVFFRNTELMKHCKQAREILWVSLFRFLNKKFRKKI